ncbi:hypothetical protein H0194_10100 [Corynebacterium incognita]|uniref:Secreted protein n=1 Tax=Corynebacterium incognita TaxID=2754725 RepID=A0A7G7CP54_9CORY|nr:hypothetical protein [Corynebacterium incognita]QNE89370.1 hypothetical protein H0194_10100 [Corynebacterium incognita]
MKRFSRSAAAIATSTALVFAGTGVANAESSTGSAELTGSAIGTGSSALSLVYTAASIAIVFGLYNMLADQGYVPNVMKHLPKF